MLSPTDLSTDSMQPPVYKISFHQRNGKLDGHFIDIPEQLITIILNQLPKDWIAIIYLQHTNEPLSTYHH
jgi:hypothetical protein